MRVDEEQIKEQLKSIKTVLLNKVPSTDYSLYSGNCGDVLFLSYLGENEAVESLLNRLIEAINNFNELSFGGGLIGASWTLKHLEKQGIVELDTGNFHQEVAALAYQFAAETLQQKDFDFIHGALGALPYLLEVNANDQIHKITGILHQISKQNKKGMFWEAVPFAKEDKEKQIIDLGLSHGLASIIAQLSIIIKEGFETAQVKEMLKKTSDFLVQSKNKNDEYAQYPNSIIDGKTHYRSRLAWCYGDLGIANALLLAGEALDDKGLQEEAIQTGLRTTKRRLQEDTLLYDAAFCHGTSGVAHLYQHLYKKTKEISFKEASDYWIKETLAQANFEDGLAGFKSWNGKKKIYQNDYSLLEGLTGIGIVLHTYLNEMESNWNRAFLLD